MTTGSFASAGIDSKRQRALSAPRANADMKTFTPDSSIASDVIPSPNHGDRNNGRLADMIVLHYTGMPDVEGAIAQLCTPGTEVSAHYIVLEDGRIVQSVPEAKRAWHAGASFWAGDVGARPGGGARRRFRHGRPAPSRGEPRRRHDPALLDDPHVSRSASAASTTSTTTPRATRSAAFAAQIALANERGLPLVIHTRDAWADTSTSSPPRACPSAPSSTASPAGLTRLRQCSTVGAYLSVQRHRHVQDGRRPARGGAAVPRRPNARRDRQPVPRAGAAPRPDEPAGVRRRGRRPPRRGRGDAVGRARAHPHRGTHALRFRPCVRSVFLPCGRSGLNSPFACAGSHHDHGSEHPMMNTHDRHRLAFAIALTVVALPALGSSARPGRHLRRTHRRRRRRGHAVGPRRRRHRDDVRAAVTGVPRRRLRRAAPQLVPAQHGTPLAADHADVRASYRRYRSTVGLHDACVRGGVTITVTNLTTASRWCAATTSR